MAIKNLSTTPSFGDYTCPQPVIVCKTVENDTVDCEKNVENLSTKGLKALKKGKVLGILEVEQW